MTVTALNFRGPQVLWDFGDGSTASAPGTVAGFGGRAGIIGPIFMTHAYKLPGNYTISARDENGASEKRFQAVIRVLGVSDQVNVELAEITLDNGKYYKVVPKNSKNIRAQLKMKMRGTGIVSGYWIVDNQPYQFFNETVFQGQIKTIPTMEIPGLPVFDPGMHTITVQLTRPADEIVFQTLRYFVLPYDERDRPRWVPGTGLSSRKTKQRAFPGKALSAAPITRSPSPTVFSRCCATMRHWNG